MERYWFDIAQFCRNGHLINVLAGTEPSRNEAFCDRCGEPTTMRCASCGALIRGAYHVNQVMVTEVGGAPGYCWHCGYPYPWTEAALAAAAALAEEIEDLSEEDRALLKESLGDLVRETPRTQLATVRYRRIMAEVGKDIAEAFREILVNVVSETVRRTLFGA